MKLIHLLISNLKSKYNPVTRITIPNDILILCSLRLLGCYHEYSSVAEISRISVFTIHKKPIIKLFER